MPSRLASIRFAAWVQFAAQAHEAGEVFFDLVEQ
jgi:hypothetical protein